MANSMGLVADSLDMLADSIVYWLSLFAVGEAVSRKKNVARAAGYFQLALAVLGFAEVIRRYAGHGETPNFQLMIRGCQIFCVNEYSHLQSGHPISVEDSKLI